MSWTARCPALLLVTLAMLLVPALAVAGGLPSPVRHPILFNASTNDPGVDEAPGLGINFSVSSTQLGVDAVEDAFGNQDGGVEPGTFIFGDTGTADNGNDVMGDGGETVDFIEWQTSQPVSILGYWLLLTQTDPFGRNTELVRFLVDGVERDFFDNDSASGSPNPNIIERPFGAFVTGSTFRIEITRATNGPRIWEIDALTESFCGSGAIEGSETCDDGNFADGDGCSSECQCEPEVCGDGVVGCTELCDDGNTVDGDGCSAVCTNFGCGNGVVDVEESCDDGNTADGDGCDEFCQVEVGFSLCPAAPAGGCLAAEKASLAISEKKPGSEKWKAKLKGLDGPTAQGDFGDPVSGSTRFDVCVYDGADQLVAGMTIDRAGSTCGAKAKPCWKDKRGRGWSYKDPDASASGAKKVAVASGPIGKGQLQVQAGNKAKKGQVALASGVTAALQGAAAARVQVLSSDAACFEASLGTVKKADADLFKAKAP